MNQEKRKKSILEHWMKLNSKQPMRLISAKTSFLVEDIEILGRYYKIEVIEFPEKPGIRFYTFIPRGPPIK